MKINEIEEEKQSRFWSIALKASTVAVLCIGIFFVVKLFTTNPIEGKWAHQDSNLILEIPNTNKDDVDDDKEIDLMDTLVKASWIDENSGNTIVTGYDFEVDYKGKSIILTLNSEAFSRTLSENKGVTNEAALKSSVKSLEGTYVYSVSVGELTLNNVAYDGAMVFDKKKN